MPEHFEHDECANCRCASLPAENVPDQQLRVCPECGDDWWEDLNLPPYKVR